MPLIPYIFATWKFINFESVQEYLTISCPRSRSIPRDIGEEALNKSGRHIDKPRYTMMLWTVCYLVPLIPENREMVMLRVKPIDSWLHLGFSDITIDNSTHLWVLIKLSKTDPFVEE